MKRTELGKKYVKNKTYKNVNSHKEQWNFCSKFYKKESKKINERLDLKVIDNKEFWKTIKVFLYDKVTTFSKILLAEKVEIISDESKVANSSSDFFENAIRLLNTKAKENSHESCCLNNPVEIAIKKFEEHPSITLLAKKLLSMKVFISYKQNLREFSKKLLIWKIKNETLKHSYLPTQDVSDVCSPILANI